MKKKYKTENYPYPVDEVIKDSFVIELLNRMKYKEVKMFNDNPEWLLEILVDYKNRIEKDERSSTRTKEEKDKKEEKIVEPESEKEAEHLKNFFAGLPFFYFERDENKNKSLKVDENTLRKRRYQCFHEVSEKKGSFISFNLTSFRG